MKENKIELPIKLLDETLPMPSYAYPGDAGLDLRSSTGARVRSGQRAIVPTGIAVAIPDGFAGLVLPRSGLAAKHGIALVNAPGLIDSHYRGEIKVVLINHDPWRDFVIRRGDRIAQLVLVRVPEVQCVSVEELGDTKRGSNGFGSSG